MSEPLDLNEANELRKSALRLVGRGQRSAALRIVHEHLDRIQSDPDASHVDCKAGCAYCCSLPVLLTMPEAEALAESIRASDRAAEMTSRLEADFERIRGLSVSELALTRLPCPLLDGSSGQGTCAYYEARPLACRAFTSPDVGECKRAYSSSTYQGDHPARPVDYLTHTLAASGLAGASDRMFELRGIVLLFLTKAGRKEIDPASCRVPHPAGRA